MKISPELLGNTQKDMLIGAEKGPANLQKGQVVEGVFQQSTKPNEIKVSIDGKPVTVLVEGEMPDLKAGQNIKLEIVDARKGEVQAKVLTEEKPISPKEAEIRPYVSSLGKLDTALSEVEHLMKNFKLPLTQETEKALERAIKTIEQVDNFIKEGVPLEEGKIFKGMLLEQLLSKMEGEAKGAEPIPQNTKAPLEAMPLSQEEVMKGVLSEEIDPSKILSQGEESLSESELTAAKQGDSLSEEGNAKEAQNRQEGIKIPLDLKEGTKEINLSSAAENENEAPKQTSEPVVKGAETKENQEKAWVRAVPIEEEPNLKESKLSLEKEPVLGENNKNQPAGKLESEPSLRGQDGPKEVNVLQEGKEAQSLKTLLAEFTPKEIKESLAFLYKIKPDADLADFKDLMLWQKGQLNLANLVEEAKLSLANSEEEKVQSLFKKIDTLMNAQKKVGLTQLFSEKGIKELIDSERQIRNIYKTLLETIREEGKSEFKVLEKQIKQLEIIKEIESQYAILNTGFKLPELKYDMQFYAKTRHKSKERIYTALMNLETSHLGKMMIYVLQQRQKGEIHFYADAQESLKWLQESQSGLRQNLSQHLNGIDMIFHEALKGPNPVHLALDMDFDSLMDVRI